MMGLLVCLSCLLHLRRQAQAKKQVAGLSGLLSLAFLVGRCTCSKHQSPRVHLRTSMPIKVIDLTVHDIRFPTSRALDGSDAMNPAPDYSATYVVLKTDAPQGLAGHGLTFTIGRGNEISVAAAKSLTPLVVGATLAEIFADIGGLWHYLTTRDSEIPCLGPEKGAIATAGAAVVNAEYGLCAKFLGKPLCKRLVDMSPPDLVHCLD